MLARRLKAIREAKSWSQEHLAAAARLNVRTIQRIEAGDRASHETLLSLAAALDVEVSDLRPEDSNRHAPPGLPRPRAALAAILMSPAALFVAANLLRSAGLSAPYDLLAEVGQKLMSFKTFNFVSPIVFLGGGAAALSLCLPALVKLRIDKVDRGAVSINGIELRLALAPLVIASVALLSAAILLAYAALESLRSPLF